MEAVPRNPSKVVPESNAKITGYGVTSKDDEGCKSVLAHSPQEMRQKRWSDASY
jgi:hypothetical protein